MAIENKAPGKDASAKDLTDKFTLVAKMNPEHRSRFTISDVNFGVNLVPVFADPSTVENEEMTIEITQNAKRSDEQDGYVEMDSNDQSAEPGERGHNRSLQVAR